MDRVRNFLPLVHVGALSVVQSLKNNVPTTFVYFSFSGVSQNANDEDDSGVCSELVSALSQLRHHQSPEKQGIDDIDGNAGLHALGD